MGKVAQCLVLCLLIAPVVSFIVTALRGALSLWWVPPPSPCSSFCL